MSEARGQSHFKVVLLGNAGVGKSCIVLRFVRDEYREDQETTIGAAFLTKNIYLEDANVKVEIWDVSRSSSARSSARARAHRALRARAHRALRTRAHRARAAHALAHTPRRPPSPTGTRLASLPTPLLLSAQTAGQERYRSLAPMYYRGAAAAIVVYDVTSRDSFDGAKTWVKELQRKGDPGVVLALAGNKADLRDKRKVDAEEAREYAAENGMIFFETSAKDAVNIERVFHDVARKVPRQQAPKRTDVVPLRAPAGGSAATGAAAGGVSKSGCC